MSPASKERPDARAAAARARFDAAVRRSLGGLLRRKRRGGQRTRVLVGRVQQRWRRIMSRILPQGGSSTGNRVRLLPEGDQAWSAMWEAIESARQRVWLETYIMEPDALGQGTLERLRDAAARGCEVLLLYDHFGSHKLGSDFLASLVRAGGQVHAFNPIWAWHRHGPLLMRDHRKILVVDDRIAFCGGLNASEDYAGEKLGNGLFRDTHLSVEGPAVADLAGVVQSSLRAMGVRSRRVRGPIAPLAGGVVVQVLEANRLRNRSALQRTLRLTLERAVQRCAITTPYFVPPRRLRRAIARAALRGVEVRILTAGRSDVPMAALASQHVYEHFLRRGVRIFEYGHSCPRVLHAKCVSIDGVYATVGSFNFDTWSWNRNLEVNVGVLDPEIALELERHFEHDLECAREVTLAQVGKRSLWLRWLHACAYHLMRL